MDCQGKGLRSCSTTYFAAFQDIIIENQGGGSALPSPTTKWLLGDPSTSGAPSQITYLISKTTSRISELMKWLDKDPQINAIPLNPDTNKDANTISDHFAATEGTVCHFTKDCPDDFEEVEGIDDRCFKVASSEGRPGMKLAEKYCQEKNSTVFEPNNKGEMLALDGHFSQMSGMRYFVGFAESRTEFGCKDKGNMEFHSITTCINVDRGDDRWEVNEPLNYKETGEWCVESRVPGALNTVPCNFAEATFIICQFNKHCGSLQNYADIHDYEEKVQDEKEYENEDENEDKNEDEKGVKEGEGGEESDSYFQLNVAIPPIKANLKIGKGDKTQKQTNLLDNMKTAIQARHPSQIARH
ncbi:uncharacterized protein LOC142345916 [Convolutriloba macropyga]|uniref:uncharacterized protein LOC142345916 n=1 Tax=Convolutriloba macropyga TaxID=536237 RepID=UPI003F527C37